MKNRLQQLREAYPQGPLAAFTRRAMASEFEACFNDVEDADAEANAAIADIDLSVFSATIKPNRS